MQSTDDTRAENFLINQDTNSKINEYSLPNKDEEIGDKGAKVIGYGGKSIKIVMIGAGGVGKTCFIEQLVNSTFIDIYNPTLEESYRKDMIIDDSNVILNIYDTSGMEDFSAVRDQYIRIGEGFLVFYSVTTEASFQVIKNLHETIINITDDDKIPVLIVGNKSDLEDRDVQYESGLSLAKEFGWGFIEASAKTKTNVVEAFETIVRDIYRYRWEQSQKIPK